MWLSSHRPLLGRRSDWVRRTDGRLANVVSYTWDRLLLGGQWISPALASAQGEGGYLSRDRLVLRACPRSTAARLAA
jgi:hypothetical protein